MTRKVEESVVGYRVFMATPLAGPAAHRRHATTPRGVEFGCHDGVSQSPKIVDLARALPHLQNRSGRVT
jgi:hypothetical protein